MTIPLGHFTDKADQDAFAAFAAGEPYAYSPERVRNWEAIGAVTVGWAGDKPRIIRLTDAGRKAAQSLREGYR